MTYRWRKKPVEIRAVRYDGQGRTALDFLAFTTGGEHIPGRVPIDGDADALLVHTLEGTVRCEVGDWLICGVRGELYPCKPDIFEATYERVECEGMGTGPSEPTWTLVIFAVVMVAAVVIIAIIGTGGF